MNKQELLDEYENGELESVARLQNLREPIREYTGKRVPVRPADAEDWWADNKSAVSQKLHTDDESEGDAEIPDEVDDEDTEEQESSSDEVADTDTEGDGPSDVTEQEDEDEDDDNESDSE